MVPEMVKRGANAHLAGDDRSVSEKWLAQSQTYSSPAWATLQNSTFETTNVPRGSRVAGYCLSRKVRTWS